MEWHDYIHTHSQTPDYSYPHVSGAEHSALSLMKDSVSLLSNHDVPLMNLRASATNVLQCQYVKVLTGSTKQ